MPLTNLNALATEAEAEPIKLAWGRWARPLLLHMLLTDASGARDDNKETLKVYLRSLVGPSNDNEARYAYPACDFSVHSPY